jgi:chromosome partitioning protein
LTLVLPNQRNPNTRRYSNLLDTNKINKMAAHTIAFSNHKGGVGKTTSVANIGAALAKRGRKVLLVDLDAQRNLTSSFLPDADVEKQDVTIYEALRGEAALPIVPLRDGLALVPAGIELAKADLQLSQQLAREQLLKRALAPHVAAYDYILLDCPPSLGVLTINALTAADAVYIPLTAETLPLKGLRMLEEVAEEIRSTLNPSLSLSGVFVTKYDERRSLNKAILDAIARRYGDALFKTKIRDNIAVAEAPLAQAPVVDYKPSSNGARDYEALTDEIEERWAGN